MNKLWVETLSADGAVIARQKFDQPVIDIGFGYHNDLLFEDAHFHENNLRISRLDNGDWLAESAGPGMMIQGEKGLVKSFVLHGDAVISIGKTRLRFRTRQYVAPSTAAQTGHAANFARIAILSGWNLVAILSFMLLASILLRTWLNETKQAEFSHFVTPVLNFCSIVLIWAGGWSLLSRLFAGQARFRQHLLTTLIAFLGMLIAGLLMSLIDFSLGIQSFSEITDYLIWPIVALWCYTHLRIMGRAHKWIKIAVVGMLALIGIGMQVLLDYERAPRRIQFQGMSAVLPPFLRVVPPVKMDKFFEEAGKMKAELDIERTKEPPDTAGKF